MLAKNNTTYYFLGAVGITLIFSALKRKVMSNTLTKNFSFSEFNSKDGAPMPEDVKKNIRLLANELEKIRAAFKSPIKINSGYRSPAHNKAVGGVDNSYHLKGMAADFNVKGRTPRQVVAIIEEMINRGELKQGGVGLYNGWIHYDIRGTKARWNG